MNFDFLKYFNFSMIVTEIKKIKQDESLMFFIFCMSFVLISSFLWEKEIIEFNIFVINTGFYAAALISLLIFLMKFYRGIKEKIAYKKEIHNYCSRIDKLSSEEKDDIDKKLEQLKNSKEVIIRTLDNEKFPVYYKNIINRKDIHALYVPQENKFFPYGCISAIESR